MNGQDLINILIGMTGSLLGYVLHGIKQSVDALHKADTEMIDRVQAMELLVAGHYVTRGDHEHHMTRLFQKLDTIEDKLDRKVDR